MTSRTRPRGRTDWRPATAKTRERLQHVQEILAEYDAHLPLTLRQIFYRLVAAHGYPKDDKGYANLSELLSNARRTRVAEHNVPFDAIRDDGTVAHWPKHYASPEGFHDETRARAARYALNRQTGQAVFVEMWVEAAGMVPQIYRAVADYSVPVISSGGFDSVTLKHEAAVRIARREQPTRVLYVGDWDPSGRAMLANVAEDVPVLEPGAERADFTRVAVTSEQTAAYGLESRRVRNTHGEGESVQVEALPPDALAREIRLAVTSLVDVGVRERLLAREVAERTALWRGSR